MGVKMGLERKEKSPFRFFVPLLKDDHFCDRYT